MPTPIRLTAGNLSISTELNDTVAALDFKKRLPLKLTGYRSAVDYCCSVACGLFDPHETQSGWRNGDISIAGGWLAIFYDGEEQSEDYRDLMVIAHLKEDEIEQIRKLPDTVKIAIELET